MLVLRTAEELGIAIRERRMELGLTQSELADRAGVGRQWLVEVEQGKPRAQIDLLLRTLFELRLDLSIEPRPERSELDDIVDVPSSGIGE
ncbi:MAG: helix-turn-helix domain-containing protein [Planctomycetota bacterium]